MSYKDTLPSHTTLDQAKRSSKPYYEHPVYIRKMARLTKEDYESIPENVRKHILPAATPATTDNGKGYKNLAHKNQVKGS